VGVIASLDEENSSDSHLYPSQFQTMKMSAYPQRNQGVSKSQKLQVCQETTRKRVRDFDPYLDRWRHLRNGYLLEFDGV
jgi:hypothetical protein